jgi:TrmH family RNA methyltransferase
VEGHHAVGEAKAAGLLLQLFVTAAALERHQGLAAGVPVVEVGERTLRGLTGAASPPGVLGVSRLVARPLAEVLAGLDSPHLVAVGVAVGDPGNAGSLIRAADAAGAAAVVFAGEPRPGGGVDPGVDPHNDKCVRGSAGSLFHLPIATVADVGGAARSLAAAGLALFAADAHGGADIDASADRSPLACPAAWLFGHEARGLAPDTLALADAAWRVPVYGRAESLNLATAAALCLYASARAQRQGRR